VRTKRIAIIDDDASVRRVILRLSRTLPCAAEAFDSAEALLAARPERFDCLIVDIHMPGMDGIAMLERLAEAGITVPSIVLSARPQPALFRKARAAGAVSLFVKPFNLRELEGAIREALHG